MVKYQTRNSVYEVEMFNNIPVIRTKRERGDVYFRILGGLDPEKHALSFGDHSLICDGKPIHVDELVDYVGKVELGKKIVARAVDSNGDYLSSKEGLVIITSRVLNITD
jgi:hypothetical protein